MQDSTRSPARIARKTKQFFFLATVATAATASVVAVAFSRVVAAAHKVTLFHFYLLRCVKPLNNTQSFQEQQLYDVFRHHIAMLGRHATGHAASELVTAVRHQFTTEPPVFIIPETAVVPKNSAKVVLFTN